MKKLSSFKDFTMSTLQVTECTGIFIELINTVRQKETGKRYL